VDSLRDAGSEFVAIDGKTSRRAHRSEAHPLHLVSAWASRQRLVLGQEAVGDDGSKGSEITAIPLRTAPGKQSLAIKRKSAGWDDQFLLRALTQAAP